MRGQLTDLWRAADSQPLPWQNPQRFGWSVWESGVPTGVRQQGSGAAGLPRCRFFTQVHVYRSPPPQSASREGFCPEQRKDPNF